MYEYQITIFDLLKPIPVEVKGLCDDGYCPNCRAALDDLVTECPACHTVLDWERWKDINADFVKELINE